MRYLQQTHAQKRIWISNEDQKRIYFSPEVVLRTILTNVSVTQHLQQTGLLTS